MKPASGFLGTYFDRETAFRIERWARLIAWSVLAIYLIQAGYNAYQNINGAWTGGYPLDWYSLFSLLAQVAQGGVLFILLQIAAQILLILLDIEDNTRRAARANSKEG